MSASAQEPVGGGLNRGGPLDGEHLGKAFEAATRCLERQRDAINALNVFPVPDGDTGTNMLLTMRSVTDEYRQAPGPSAGAVTAALAHGALLGARGNSGVILSQFFHGLAQGLQGKDESSGEDLAQAFKLASSAASSAVSKPVDGTMLTVIRELSMAAARQVESDQGYSDPLSVWRVAVDGAKESLSMTPMQLPVLREAGVVDAGGQGVVTLLEGALGYLAGEDVDAMELELVLPRLDGPSSDAPIIGTTGRPAVQEECLAATEDELYGYCTQFLIRGQGLDVDKIRQDLSGMAESTVVVGNDGLVKVHVHVHDPGPVISYSVSVGSIGEVKIDDIDQQHREFVALHRGGPAAGPTDASLTVAEQGSRPDGPLAEGIGVAAVAWGEGFVQLFQGLGCAKVVSGGQTMNPSTQELLTAAGEVGARDMILLPNNTNIVPAARQAASIASQSPDLLLTEAEEGTQGMTLHVVPSRTIPQGVAALLAFNPEGDLDSNLESMERALATVRTIEVTRAVRPAKIGQLAVNEGDYIGLLDGELVAAGDSALSALEQTLSEGGPEGGDLVTLYWGEGIEEGQALEAAARLRESTPGLDVEVVYGGQPLYQYIASLE